MFLTRVLNEIIFTFFFEFLPPKIRSSQNFNVKGAEGEKGDINYYL